jgi:branched-chain amino acid transport system substrate-binding protein
VEEITIMKDDRLNWVSRRALLAAGGALFPALAVRRVCAQEVAAPVKIGVLCDMSGVYADDTGPGLLLAVQLAAQDFGNKVMGRPVSVISADDQNKPDVGMGIARHWLDEENVQSIVCGSASSITMAAARLVHERNRILLIGGSLSEDLTGKSCQPSSFQFGIDTYASTRAVVTSAMAAGLTSWYIINVDYAFGHDLLQDATAFVAKAGGKFLGSTAFPLNTSDMSSYLLRAQASGAKAVGLACGGADWTNLVKQGHEFGITSNGQTLVALASGFPEVRAVGLESAQGMMLTTPFYWDANDGTRAFAKRFMAAHNGVAPDWQQASAYSATAHYLKAVQAAGTTEGAAVAKAMRAIKVQDFTVDGATIREDGQVMRPAYLVQVKSPKDSRNTNDVFRIVSSTAAADTWRSAAESACPLLRPL